MLLQTVEQKHIRMDQFADQREAGVYTCLLNQEKIQSALVFMLNICHAWFEWVVTLINQGYLKVIFLQDPPILILLTIIILLTGGQMK